MTCEYRGCTRPPTFVLHILHPVARDLAAWMQVNRTSLTQMLICQTHRPQYDEFAAKHRRPGARWSFFLIGGR